VDGAKNDSALRRGDCGQGHIHTLGVLRPRRPEGAPRMGVSLQESQARGDVNHGEEKVSTSCPQAIHRSFRSASAPAVEREKNPLEAVEQVRLNR